MFGAILHISSLPSRFKWRIFCYFLVKQKSKNKITICVCLSLCYKKKVFMSFMFIFGAFSVNFFTPMDSLSLLYQDITFYDCIALDIGSFPAGGEQRSQGQGGTKVHYCTRYVFSSLAPLIMISLTSSHVMYGTGIISILVAGRGDESDEPDS